MWDIKFRIPTILKVIKNLKVDSAACPDNIPTSIIKNCAPEPAPIFSKIFKLSYTCGIFPISLGSWKITRIQPITKKGDSSNVVNYRPIAITSVLSKIMEKVINEQVLHHLESNNLIHDRQYAFRQFQSTGDILANI